MKKKDKFIQIVHTLIQVLACRQPKLTLEEIAVVLGKSYKVLEEDLIKTSGNISDKAMEFLRYQLYLTDIKPSWYSGEQK